MTVIWLNIENSDLDLWFRRDFEELAVAVALNIKGNDARRATAASRSIYHLQPRTHSCELCVEQLSNHGDKRHRLERESFMQINNIYCPMSASDFNGSHLVIQVTQRSQVLLSVSCSCQMRSKYSQLLKCQRNSNRK